MKVVPGIKQSAFSSLLYFTEEIKNDGVCGQYGEDQEEDINLVTCDMFDFFSSCSDASGIQHKACLLVKMKR